MGSIDRCLRQIVCLPIKLYQYLIRPLLNPCCRYHPSCSEYTHTAIEHFGVIKGVYMGLKRIMRCHPWSKSGYDPVLPNKEKL